MNKLLAGRRVLVVEDEMMLLWIIQDMMADLGCDNVNAARTVDQAIALIDSESFDVAMLDLNLNGIKSYPVADALTARAIPFIFATGYNTRAVLEGYRDRPVLKKPFKFEVLESTLSSIILPPATAASVASSA